MESSGARRGWLHGLDFADDISALAKIGLRINCEKTKAMKIGPEQHHPILVMQQNVDYV